MKEVYEKNIIDRAKKELKINDDILKIEVKNYGEQITVDGMEFFEKINSVVVKYQNYDVVYYDLENKSISYPRYIKNVSASKYTVKIVNNFLGEERIKLPKNINSDVCVTDDMLLHMSEQEIYDAYGVIL